ncbi:DUF2397 family protein [Streptomyces sp. NPDC001480]|uniref:DUF2397 family protein n=1 Tax=Streptomyces sp. NPDC001480 TaxID=3364577 RepID=UPI0036CAD98B
MAFSATHRRRQDAPRNLAGIEAPAPGAAQNAATQDVQYEARRRLDAYTYLSAPERLEHLAIMRVFCGTLLADLAVPDVLAKLRQAGGPAAGLDADALTVRLEELVKWGNLLRSSHTVKASSISEYQRSRARYQLSKLGERIQRDADGVLAEADAAREVSNELLALVERGLRELAEFVTAPGGIEPQDGLERVSTLFVQFTARLAEEARALAVTARAEADATATAHDLPSDPAELERVRTALAALLTGIGHLRRAIGSTGERLGTHHADAERYERARTERLAAEETTGFASPGCVPRNRTCAPARKPSGRPKKRSSPASRKPDSASRTPSRPSRQHNVSGTICTTGACARKRRRSACART